MNISYRETNPPQEDYYRLFLTTGWNEKYQMSADDLAAAISQSWYVVSAYDADRLVGYGRVIADGIHHALIVDMIVDPEYQGKQIGATILKMIIARCRKHTIRDIQLFSARGKAGFYRKFGFVCRADDAPGMQLPFGGSEAPSPETEGQSVEIANGIPATIRPIGGADEIGTCARLMSTTEPWITLGRTYEASLKILTDTTREISVGLIDGGIVGFMVLVMKGAFTGYIQTVCVAPQWRNQGIGRALLAIAEKRIFRDSPNVFLCVSSFNPDALRLYVRLGYEVVGELKDFIVAGHSEILMRKTIGPMSEFKKA